MFSNRNEVNLVKRKVGSKTIYYYSFYDDDGIRRYRSTGQRTKALAWDYVLKRRDDGMLKAKEMSNMRFGDYAKDFFDYDRCPIVRNKLARGKRFARSTAYNQRHLLTGHILPYFKDIPMSHMTENRINSWLLNLPEDHKVGKSTANQCRIVLTSILDQAVKDGVIRENPCRNVERLGNDSKRHPAFTRDEVKRFIGEEKDWPNPLYRLMCIIGAMTGMRIAEVLALKPEDVQEDRIAVRHSFNAFDGEKTPKNGEERTVPITKELHDLLMQYSLGKGKFIFSETGDKPLTYQTAAEKIRKRMEKTGIKKTFHSFREFVNTELSLSNLNETVIQQIVGHKDDKMTEHYLHLESGDLKLIRDVQEDIYRNVMA